MGLTQSQRAIITKARAVGGGKQGTSLTDEMCAYLTVVIARDLGLTQHFPEAPADLAPFFEKDAIDRQQLADVDFLDLFERLVGLDANADMYFACLASLHKARLKYHRILETQPIPTIDQVGPRGLLQYGTVSA